jgi:hypothetical protein
VKTVADGAIIFDEEMKFVKIFCEITWVASHVSAVTLVKIVCATTVRFEVRVFENVAIGEVKFDESKFVVETLHAVIASRDAFEADKLQLDAFELVTIVLVRLDAEMFDERILEANKFVIVLFDENALEAVNVIVVVFDDVKFDENASEAVNLVTVALDDAKLDVESKGVIILDAVRLEKPAFDENTFDAVTLEDVILEETKFENVAFEAVNVVVTIEVLALTEVALTDPITALDAKILEAVISEVIRAFEDKTSFTAKMLPTTCKASSGFDVPTPKRKFTESQCKELAD